MQYDEVLFINRYVLIWNFFANFILMLSTNSFCPNSLITQLILCLSFEFTFHIQKDLRYIFIYNILLPQCQENSIYLNWF